MKRMRLLCLVSLVLACILLGCREKENEKPSAPAKDVNELTFSAEGGVYGKEFDLSIASPAGSSVVYTLDGSDPRISGSAIEYTEPIKITSREKDANVLSAIDPDLFSTNFLDNKRKCYINPPEDSAVDKCTVVRAAQKNADGTYSEVASHTYFIGTMEEHIKGLSESCKASGIDLAVISITMSEEDLFDHERGIYVKGAVFDESFAKWNHRDELRKLTANYSSRGSEWERAAHMEMYETNANGMNCVLSQDCGIRIQGNYSRSDLQKSFRLFAREKYGNKRFQYAIWGDACKDADGNTIDSFKTIVLRNGGNCAFNMKWNDAFWQSLVAESDLKLSTQCTRAAVVYLNGEYWGLYVLEEDYSTEYFDDHYNVPNENVVIYKGDAETYSCGYRLDEGELPEGEKEDYFLRGLIMAEKSCTSLANQETYEKFCELVDAESFMDYFALEVWINNKWDWPGKNWSIWRSAKKDDSNPYADGRFRLIVYDVEFGGISGKGDATTNTMKEDNYKPLGLLDQDTNNVIVKAFALLMTNEGFKQAYCERLTSLSEGALNKEKALARVEEFLSIYEPLYDQFFERYPGAGSTEEALHGGYASADCLTAFISKRESYIPKIVEWTNKH